METDISNNTIPFSIPNKSAVSRIAPNTNDISDANAHRIKNFVLFKSSERPKTNRLTIHEYPKYVYFEILILISF